MTAEALLCRQFLGLRRDSPLAAEAVESLAGELPGTGEANLYYWYYGTLALYHHQGAAWESWNAALKRTLISSQRTGGDLDGSWDPTSKWDGYGGRVYSTALAALSLEIYYRYLPLYAGELTASRAAANAGTNGSTSDRASGGASGAGSGGNQRRR
jgi:hypothetical protein